ARRGSCPPARDHHPCRALQRCSGFPCRAHRQPARFHADRLPGGPVSNEPIRILFVFAWLVVGGEETEVRLLAQHLDPARYQIEVVVCFRKEGMPDQTHDQLRQLGVDVDTAPYALSFEDTVAYLARKIADFDI